MLADSFETWIIQGRVFGKGWLKAKAAQVPQSALFTESARKPDSEKSVSMVQKEILTVLQAHFFAAVVIYV